MDQIILNRVETFAHTHGIVYTWTNLREWGSWDLVIKIPSKNGVVVETGQTFGYGYSDLEGFAVFLEKVTMMPTDSQPYQFFVNMFGEGIIEEMKNLFKVEQDSTSTALVTVR